MTHHLSRALLLGTALLCPTLATAQVQGWTATINDPMSHGTLGDNKLSLDEAIRIMNTALPLGSLSAMEQAQVDQTTGILPALQVIVVDASITPTITIQSELTNVIGDTVTHIDTDFVGISGPAGQPVIDATGKAVTVFPSKTNHFHLTNFEVRGGNVGVSFDSSLHYHPGIRGLFKDCLFRGQQQKAVVIQIPSFPPGEIEPADFIDSTFMNVPLAIQLLDNGISGTMNVTGKGNSFQGCDVAIQADILGSGSQCKALFQRTTVSGAENAVRVTRNPASSSVLDLQFVYGEFRASQSAFDVEGTGIGPTVFALHHADVFAGAGIGDFAVRTHPNSARFDVSLGEMAISGDVLLQSNGLGGKMRAHHTTFRNGSVRVDSIGAPPSFLYDVFESAPVTVAARTGAKPVTIDFSELVRSDVTDLNSTSVTTIFSSYLGSSTVTNAAVLAPGATRWYGTGRAIPEDPPVGGHFDLQVDLQPDTAVIWLLGLPLATPITSTIPFRFYLDFGLSLTVPGQYVLQDKLRILIPNDQALRGAELYALPALFPTAGQPHVPGLTLHRGSLIVIQ